MTGTNHYLKTENLGVVCDVAIDNWNTGLRDTIFRGEIHGFHIEVSMTLTRCSVALHSLLLSTNPPSIRTHPSVSNNHGEMGKKLDSEPKVQSSATKTIGELTH